MEKLTPDLSGVAPRGCAVPLAVLKCIAINLHLFLALRNHSIGFGVNRLVADLTPKQAQLLRSRLPGRDPSQDHVEAIMQARGSAIARRVVVRTTRNPPSETAMCRNTDDSVTEHPSGAAS